MLNARRPPLSQATIFAPTNWAFEVGGVCVAAPVVH
jgi:hypothetical protein